ncbi:MAG: HPP family protein [Magnetococcus sp. XQGC-1]
MENAESYFAKMRGYTTPPPRPPLAEIFWSWLGAFLGIGLMSIVDHFFLASTDLVLVIGSFGASAVLVYGAITSPLAQPRNLLGGHFISALIGVAIFTLLPQTLWLASALAVACAIAAMQITATLHPPGGATALIAVIGSDRLHALGFLYALVPALSGAIIMLVVALLVNNIPKGRRYPLWW